MFKKLAIVWLAIGLSGCGSLLFYPMSQWVRTPADLGLNYHDVRLPARDGTPLHAWWLEAEGTVKGTVIFLHGNAENISTHIGSVYWLPEQGYQVLMLDYRGFGESAGVPTIPTVVDDIRTTFEWVFTQSNVADKPVYLLAQSLGAAMGGFAVGSDRNIASRLHGVVLDAGFSDYASIAQDVAASHWLTWILQYPASWMMPKGYDLKNVVGDISPVPLLIFHGDRDEVIPLSHAHTLFAKAKAPKYLLTYSGGHIQTFEDVANRKALLEFFNQHR